jgi:hypothetical protein
MGSNEHLRRAGIALVAYAADIDEVQWSCNEIHNLIAKLDLARNELEKHAQHLANVKNMML